MTKHLQFCMSENLQSEQSNNRIFLIKAAAGPFWVYFEVDASSTLGNIDRFLRDLWLECCGHLSAFTIDSSRYYSHREALEPGEKGMDIPLRQVLSPGAKFRHEYDFGTTTELDLQCISERKGKVRSKTQVMARNDMPEILCDECGKPAKEICTECLWEGKGLLCESCVEDHECDEEMLLPVVNSPRMGECGYTG
ncbi:hypothetical protein LCGC14_1816630 [marine sediment metagenome]|uniref:Uncharacterized protein n=1 Tax=marine sediment metagenome TaxID=412755 RepID=A0A0F9H894_9ZZZZ